MFTLRDHNVEDYAALPDMDTTDVDVLDAGDRACLDELGQYLVSAGAWRRFAIWLLHKHFEPAAGEVFVERATTAPRGTQTSPVGRGFVPVLHATSVRFDPDAGCGVGVIGMEFAGPGDFGCTPPMTRDDGDALCGIAERLRAHGKTGRFGVRLIRNPLGLTENELLVETCDIANRTLRCTVRTRDGISAEDGIETTWRWKPSGPAVMQWCQMMCGYDGSGNHYAEGHITFPDSNFGAF